MTSPTAPKTTHTPAPWMISDQAVDKVYVYVCDERGLAIAMAHRRANAQLIASAPELLARLKHLVHWHDQLTPTDIAKAKAVVAKAEGRAP